jgi:hypothetical protein
MLYATEIVHELMITLFTVPDSDDQGGKIMFERHLIY